MRYARPFAAFAANAFRLTLLACLSLALSLCAAAPGRAQDLSIYTDSLQNGFQNWSWATTNLSNTAPVQSGSDSIAVTYAGAYQGFYLHSGSIDTANYSALNFWVNGGASGGQRFTISMIHSNGNAYAAVPISNYVPGGAIPANQWVQVTIPFADLQVANTTDFGGFWFQDSAGGVQPVYYVDTISFLAQPPPPVVHVAVNASQALQTVDDRDFGANELLWDYDLGLSSTASLMNAAGARAFRFPGGSAGDAYDWTVLQYNGQSATPTFGTLTDGTGGQGIITANYGSGSPQMAAAWVAYCNAMPSSTVTIGLDSAGRDWKTASYWASLRDATPLQTDDGLNFLRVNHPVPYGFKTWEIGNECYGSWETDNHASKQDPVTYANAAKAMTALMKQVDPTIQTGVVVTSSEDGDGNQTETVTNPVTGVQHKGWTSVLFSTLNSLNYTPDFVIYHNYAQAPGSENDAFLLQYAQTWIGDAQSIRTMLTDYMGTKAAHSQLVCTENNSVYGNPGKQTTSLVNGLFYAQSLGYLMQTEFKGLIWWSLRDESEVTTNNNASSLYGWRQYGDYAMLGSLGAQPGGGNEDTPYPSYFALKLASHFARGGDTIVPAASDYSSLSAFAAKRATGGLSLMVVNTSPSATLTTQFTLSGYTPAGTATTYQYGEAQDNLQSTGATVDLAQSTLTGVGPVFSTSLPPYSMTVINLVPASPAITGFSPASGAAGTTVVITGTNLGGTTVVGFQGQHAKSFTINPAGTQITTTVPAGAVTGPIALQEPNGIIRTATSFTVPVLPSISGFSPSSGAVGTTVTITGTDLGGTTVVGFQGQHAKSFTINAQGTQITTTVPAGAVTGPIALQEPSGIIRTATKFNVAP